MKNQEDPIPIVPTPPRGYRLLKQGERLQPGDKVWIDESNADSQERLEQPYWALVWVKGGYVIDKKDPAHYSRSVGETFP